MTVCKSKITIFHYHLLPGGVTNVIVLGIKSLIINMENLESITIVCGKKKNTETVKKTISDTITEYRRNINFNICVDAEIDYSERNTKLKDESVSGLTQKLLNKYGNSFWWVHNYQLGKNPLFTAAILMVSEKYPEQKILLHIHDFPECARYNNLESLFNAGITNPYPLSNNITYAVINSRDRKLLQKAGIPQSKVFLFDNPVEDESIDNLEIDESEKKKLTSRLYKHYKREFIGLKPEGKMIFYPVRSIRRKNVHEAGLITAVLEEPVNLVLSLPGTSVQERRYSDLCRQCFKDGIISGVWGSGVGESDLIPTYPQMLKICDMILSSSVQEGFGYLFINSIKLGIPLAARYIETLDGIINFFPKDSSFFYENFKVPVRQFIIKEIRKAYQIKIDRIKKYISPKAVTKIIRSIDLLGKDNMIDFSYLNIDMQVKVLKQTAESKELKKEIRFINSELINFIIRNLSKKPNKLTKLSQFSLKKYSETVEDIISREYSDDTDFKEIPKIQQELIDSFAELKYIRLLYDY